MWPALIAAAGSVIGGMLASKGAKQSGTTTTITDLPAWQRGYAQSVLGDASAARGQIGTSTPVLDPAMQEYLKTIQGGYLSPDSNPYLKATYDQAAKDVTDAYTTAVQPRTDAIFQGPGSMGGNTAYAELVARNNYGLGQNLQNLATNIYGGNYQAERGRQFQATGNAPGFQGDYYKAAWSPYSSQMDVFAKPMGQATSQPYYTNPAAGAIGGGLLGMQLGGMIGGGTPTGQPMNYSWLSQGSSTPYVGGYGWGNV